MIEFNWDLQVLQNKLKYRTPVIIGRFQVPELHEGHLHLIEYAMKYPGMNSALILLGCQDTIDDRNPYTLDERYEMISKKYPYIKISSIYDRNNDYEWSMAVDNILCHSEYPPVLFGSRDSFHKNYKGYFPYVEVPELPGYSGTEVRARLNASKNIS